MASSSSESEAVKQTKQSKKAKKKVETKGKKKPKRSPEVSHILCWPTNVSFSSCSLPTVPSSDGSDSDEEMSERKTQRQLKVFQRELKSLRADMERYCFPYICSATVHSYAAECLWLPMKEG